MYCQQLFKMLLETSLQRKTKTFSKLISIHAQHSSPKQVVVADSKKKITVMFSSPLKRHHTPIQMYTASHYLNVFVKLIQLYTYHRCSMQFSMVLLKRELLLD